MKNLAIAPTTGIQSPASLTSKSLSSPRVIALDALRGLAVMGMILVVSPGSWSYRLPMLNHAPWHGYTLADLVFPAFLFAVGFAIALRFPSDRPLRVSAVKIARRSLSLIGLGLLLNLLPAFDWANFRIPGVLQRIGLCYGLAAFFVLVSAKIEGATRYPDMKRVVLAAVTLLVGWALVLSFTSAPGFPMGDLSQAGTFAAWIDRLVITPAHMWPYGTDAAGAVVFDPEGLLSTFPATANVLIGVVCGCWLGKAPSMRLLKLGAGVGFALVLFGFLIGTAVVINKWIWTPSFALVSSGWSLLAYCALHFASQRSAGQAVLKPVLILGGNAILAFVLCELLGKIAGMPVAGTSPQNFGFQIILSMVNEPWISSFLCALGVLSIILLMIWPLQRRGIHIRL